METEKSLEMEQVLKTGSNLSRIVKILTWRQEKRMMVKDSLVKNTSISDTQKVFFENSHI